MKDRYVLVGTSHVSKESIIKIKQAFSDLKPDIIAVELDKQRFNAMMSKQKSSLGINAIRQIGLTGYLFALIGRAIQKKIGDVVGMNPGSEMLLGAKLAKNNNLMLALIDQDVALTLKNLSKKVKFSEKMKIFGDILLAPFAKQQRIKIDLAKIPSSEFITTIMKQMKDRYPGFYRVLLDDRNRHMAKKIFLLLKNNPEKKVLAIMGAGHIEGVEKHLKSLEDSNLH